MFALTSFLLATLVAAAPGTAQDKTSEIDKIFSWATPKTPGCTVAVAHRGELVVNRAYGLADLDRNTPITPGTILDTGSLQKQFVAAAALLLVQDGKISLSDDIRKFVPELPDYGHKITVGHLLTHTSGLRDWIGIVMLTAEKADALSMILRQRGLNFPPGEEWSYSNSGFVLMKEIIARTSGMSFADFARKRLFEPLGMKSTSYASDIHGVTGDRALAYNKQGVIWKPAVLLDEDRGGGGVFSTAADLIIWNEALTSGRLGASVSEKLEEPARLNNGRAVSYGRGLFLQTYRGTTEVAHTGSADGYKAYLGRYPEHRLSVAIMCNSGDGTEPRDFAHRIFDLFVPDAAPPGPEDSPPPPVEADVLLGIEDKTGLFFDEQTGEPIRLTLDRGRFRIVSGPGLVPVSQDRFRRWGAALWFMSGDQFELHFLSPDRFELKSMEGKTTRYRRAQPFAPTADELQAYAGRFENDEIRAVFRIEPKEDGLVIRLEHAPERPLEFSPVDRDAFQFSRMTVRFRRNESGNVEAFDYSNPVLRNVRFTRLN